MADVDLKEWVALAHRLTEEDRVRNQPPEEVWSAILEDIDAVEPDGPVLAEAVPDVQPALDLNSPRTHMAPRALKRRRQRMLAGVAIGIASIVLLASFLTGGEDDDARPIAIATNSGLPEPYEGSATATVTADGNAIRVEFTDPLPDEAPVEVWLGTPDFGDQRSLGFVDDDSNVYPIPADIELADYPTIDVSIEPNDGDESHSGRSILRGRFLAP